MISKKLSTTDDPMISGDEPESVGLPTNLDASAGIQARWPFLPISERSTLLRSVALTESIFVRANWDELPSFAQIALQLRYDGQT